MAGAFEVTGGAPLRGEARVDGSRTATLAQMAAALLTDAAVHLHNASPAGDVTVQARLLAAMGCAVERTGSRITVRCPSPSQPPPDPDVRGFRAHLLFAGPLLARTGTAVLPLPGASERGPHPLDLHRKGFEALGATMHVESGRLVVHAPALRAADIYLDAPSLSATLNLMFAAAGAAGVTTLRHVSRAPEVVDVATLLARMGARIRGAGTDVLRIEGGVRLHGAEHRVMPDRHQAGLTLLAAAATRGAVRLRGAEPVHLQALLAKLSDLGAAVEAGAESVAVRADGRPLRSGIVRALPYPGFPAELLLPMLPLLAPADGASILADGSYPSHLVCLDEFRRLGIRSEPSGGSAVVYGGARLKGAPVRARGPLSGVALLIALLAAEGEGRLEEAGDIAFRYGPLDEVWRSLGAAIRRSSDDVSPLVP